MKDKSSWLDASYLLDQVTLNIASKKTKKICDGFRKNMFNPEIDRRLLLETILMIYPYHGRRFKRVKLKRYYGIYPD